MVKPKKRGPAAGLRRPQIKEPDLEEEEEELPRGERRQEASVETGEDDN